MPDEVEVMNCTFSTEASLYLAYMPFVKGGGLFIRTLQVIPMGTEMHLEIQLLHEVELYKLKAKVVWITPKGAQGNKPSGIGVQFLGDSARTFCNKIETILAAMLKSTHLTDTL
jgi:type IV pilus assembly protein PilZ